MNEMKVGKKHKILSKAWGKKGKAGKTTDQILAQEKMLLLDYWADGLWRYPKGKGMKDWT